MNLSLSLSLSLSLCVWNSERECARTEGGGGREGERQNKQTKKSSDMVHAETVTIVLTVSWIYCVTCPIPEWLFQSSSLHDTWRWTDCEGSPTAWPVFDCSSSFLTVSSLRSFCRNFRCLAVFPQPELLLQELTFFTQTGTTRSTRC